MKKSMPYIWYMLPGLIFYTAFMILPIFLTALISLAGFNGVNWDTLSWVGGDNQVKLFTDPSNSSVYWNALINNLKFIAVEYVITVSYTHLYTSPISILIAEGNLSEEGKSLGSAAYSLFSSCVYRYGSLA